MSTDNCRAPKAGPFARPKYATGSYLTAAECAAEQNHRLQQLRRHNRHLHGYGIIYGMWVVPASDRARPWAVGVCPGYAVGPYGDEIEIPQLASIDISDFLWSRPTQTAATNLPLQITYVVVRFTEGTDGLEPRPPAGCGCAEPEYCDSRIVDRFQLAAVWSAPVSPASPVMCSPGTTPCPACPDSPWLVLARVLVPASTATPITAAMIDNDIRRNV